MVPSRPSLLRGTNYYTSTATSIEKTALSMCRKGPNQRLLPDQDGFFDPRHNFQELKAIAGLGLNNIRLWSSFWAWVINPTAFKTTLAEIRDNCRSLGLSITYVVWNNVSTLAEPDVKVLAPYWMLIRSVRQRLGEIKEIRDHVWLQALTLHEAARRGRLLPPGEPWFAGQVGDPGISAMVNYRSLADLGRRAQGFELLMQEYLVDVAEVFSASNSPLFSYDLFNEPDYFDLLFTFPSMHMDVIVQSHSTLRSEHLRRNPALIPHFTVGFAGLSTRSQLYLQQLVTQGVITYVSSHAYRTIPDISLFASTIQRSAAIANNYRMDYVCSEFWERRLMVPTPAPIAPYLSILGAHSPRVGGQAWSVLENNIFFNEGPALSFGGTPIWTEYPPEAIDGLWRPTRGQWLPRNTWPASLAFSPTASASDLGAVRMWARS